MQELVLRVHKEAADHDCRDTHDNHDSHEERGEVEKVNETVEWKEGEQETVSYQDIRKKDTDKFVPIIELEVQMCRLLRKGCATLSLLLIYFFTIHSLFNTVVAQRTK
jgi:hypothetical protein